MISNIIKKTCSNNYLRSIVLNNNKISNVYLKNSLYLNSNKLQQQQPININNNKNIIFGNNNNTIRFYTTTTINTPLSEQQQPEEQQSIEENNNNNNSNNNDEIEIDFKVKILENSLKFVNQYGWTSEAVSQSCIDMGYPPTTQGIFGNDSAYELALYFVTKSNNDLLDKLSNDENNILSGLSKKEKIKLALKLRLSMIKPYIGRWSEAMQLLANPKNIVNSSPSMLNLVDSIWYLVGDKSSDFDWYAKRGLLVALYTSSELFMLSDTSVDHSNTWRFVDDRVEDLIKTIKFKNDLEQTVGITLNTLLSNFQKK